MNVRFFVLLLGSGSAIEKDKKLDIHDGIASPCETQEEVSEKMFVLKVFWVLIDL